MDLELIDKVLKKRQEVFQNTYNSKKHVRTKDENHFLKEDELKDNYLQEMLNTNKNQPSLGEMAIVESDGNLDRCLEDDI